MVGGHCTAATCATSVKLRTATRTQTTLEAPMSGLGKKHSERGLRLPYRSSWKGDPYNAHYVVLCHTFQKLLLCTRTDCPAHLGSAVPATGDPQGTTAKYGTVDPGVVGCTCIKLLFAVSPAVLVLLGWLASYRLSTQTSTHRRSTSFASRRSLLESISARASLHITSPLG